ncbi:DUF1516 family protein [Guptibacillus hwajinpoensis]|uniref:Uncharacterized protein n=1 Tax=Guptibacillus hwajinpoensis TaxID=208199 RepID=A0A0J6CT15_9BACL|nr:DUF1516 family protein [Alkalihalobacillus macyae]KMM36338.1 hypothetical protein AB986_18020 [Alkalihalobacillus macyae]
MYNILLQSHAGSWAILVLLLVVSYFAPKQKITPMIQRLFYLIMIISGVGMLVMLGFPLLYVFKGILAIMLIGFMEVIVGRRKRSESTKKFWIGAIVLLLVILAIGYNLISFN